VDRDRAAVHAAPVATFDPGSALRRIRRVADLSQRDLAASCGVAPAVIAHAEAGRRPVALAVLVDAAAVAGLRLALLDPAGTEVPGMAPNAVRDGAGRRFPAHLDTRYGDQEWWHGEERYSREQPWYTFDRVREWRDVRREELGTPEDHQLPQPGDSPQDRRAARVHAARQRREAARQRWRDEHPGPQPEAWTCECPPGCDPAREVLAEVHVEDCPCRCDIA
jgi:HTH-type transcriptional regulator/antitoxin HipB